MNTITASQAQPGMTLKTVTPINEDGDLLTFIVEDGCFPPDQPSIVILYTEDEDIELDIDTPLYLISA